MNTKRQAVLIETDFKLTVSAFKVDGPRFERVDTEEIGASYVHCQYLMDAEIADAMIRAGIARLARVAED